MGSFVVDIASDVVDANDGFTSLREAVALANADADVSTITFDASAAAFQGDALIRLTAGQLRVTETLAIDGSTAGGAVVITGDADANDRTIAGTDITDVAASGAGRLSDNTRLFNATGEAALSLTALTLTGGRTTQNDAGGGAIRSEDGAVSLTDSRLSGNSTEGADAKGGGIFSARGGVSLTGSTLSGNGTEGGGGYGGGIYSARGGVTLIGSTLSDNSTEGDFAEGGGIHNRNGAVTLTDSTLSGNSTAGRDSDGGGIFNRLGGVTLTGSTLSGNSTAGDDAAGGGIATGNGAVTLTNSTLSGNSTAGDNAAGGGIASNTGAVTLTNSTLSGNSAAGDNASGGGIASSTGAVTLTDSIVSGNVSRDGGDEIAGAGAQTLIGGNIVGDALTRADETSGGVGAADIFARTEEVIDGNGDATGVQAGVLADNGGPTETILILLGGGAQDAGGATALATDQRGEARPVGDNDLGALELQPETASLIVTIAADVVDAFDGETSLREAVAFANTQAGPSTVTFDASAADFQGDALIRLTEGQLRVTETLSIDASTAGGAVVISGDANGDDITVAGTAITDVAASLAGADLLDNNSRLFNATGDAALSLTALTLTGGRTTEDNARGGAILSAEGAVTLTASTLSGNSTAGFFAQGGAIYSRRDEVTLTSSTLSDNATSGDSAFGGGIASLDGDVTLTSSTLDGNSTSGRVAFGGAIFSNVGGVTLTNSTLSGNGTAGESARGGAIYNISDGVTATNSTLSGNSTASGDASGGGILSLFSGVTLTDSIVSGNVSGDGSGDIDGGVTLSGGTILGDALTRGDGTTATVSASDIFDRTEEVIDGAGVATGVFAGVLADNGGPTETILIVTGGAAQDAGGPTALTTDQRGADRPFGSANDLGAVEIVEPGSLVVTIAGDVVDSSDGETSLREAVSFANAQEGADTITFDAAAADFTGDALIRLTQGQLRVTDSLSIDGSTAGGAVVISGDAADNDITVGETDVTDVAASLAVDVSADGTDNDGDGQTDEAGETLLDDNSRLFSARGDAALSLTALTLTGGRTTGGNAEGGAVRSADGAVTLTDSTLSGNSTIGEAADGGGIFSFSDGVTLTNSTLSGNSTAGEIAYGGGISSVNGDVTLVNSTVSGNSTSGANAYGGGIYSRFGDVTLTNSTLSGNSTTGDGADGGGIFTVSVGVTLTNSTLTGNSTAGGNAAGGAIYSDDPVDLVNSIVSGNVSGDGSGDIDGSVTLNGGNIVGDALTRADGTSATVSASDIFDRTEEVIDGAGAATSVQAGVLADNGGPTETILILLGGAAQEAGGPTTLTTDQRGEARPVGNTDLGAVELQQAPEPGSLIVTIAGDIVDAFDGETSLREAVAFANTQAGPSTITFDASAADFQIDALIRLTGGELRVTESLSIDGATASGAVVITGDAAGDDVTVAGTNITDVAATGAALLDDNSRLFDARDDAALSLTALTLTGGRTTGNGADGGAIRSGDGAVTLIDSTLVGNSTIGQNATGGAVSSGRGGVTLTNSAISGSSTAGDSAFGGAIFSSFDGVTLTNSTLSDNSTLGALGGGIASVFGGVTLTASTVSGNSTTGGNAFGGAIYSIDAVTATNSTLVGNSTAGETAFGGAIYTRRGVTLTNSTLTGNSTAGDFAAGGAIYSFPDATLTDSIVAGNVSGDGGGEISGAVALSGGNIVGDMLYRADGTSATVSPADIFVQTEEVIDGAGAATSVQAGVLADNGGSTETVLIRVGGAAQNAGLEAPATTTDQRGDARPFDGAGDLGAVELQEAPSLVVTITADIVAEDGETSLREAVAFANAQPGDDIITFDASAADFLTDALIRLTQGQLLVTDSLSIDGSTAGGAVVISGDAADNDVTVTGTDITDVAASLAASALLSNGEDDDNDDRIDNEEEDPNDLLDDNTRLFEATGSAALSLTALTLTGGRTTGDSSARGGAIRSEDGAVVLTGSTLSGNSTAGYNSFGGGIASIGGGGVTLTNSTVSGNNTAGEFGFGGGIFSIDGDVTLTNSTVSANSTEGYFADGGGIFNSDGDVTLTNSTLSGNSTAGDFSNGGGIFSFSDGVNLTDSIVSGNVSGDGSAEIVGTQTLNGGNIVGGDLFDGENDIGDVAAAQIFDQTEEVIDANGTPTGVQAGVLADNGGPTETILILAGGSAQDTGLETPATTTDQRGEARPFGDASDIGAVELQVAPETPSLIVTIATDIVDAFDGETSLREAVAFANSDPDASTITFDANAADFTGDALIRLTQGQLLVTESLSIDGSTAGGTVVITGDAADNDITVAGTNITDVAASLAVDVSADGIDNDGDSQTDEAGENLLDDNSRLFNATGDAALSLTALTLTGGRTTGDNDEGNDEGGAIRSANGTVMLSDSTLSGNSTAGSIADGGAVYSKAGGVTISSSTISGNSTAGVTADGGGIYSDEGGVTLIGSNFSGNSTTGNNANGGAIRNIFDGMTVSNSTLSGNSTAGRFSDGGAIRNNDGAVTLVNSTLSGNSTAGRYADGGGIYSSGGAVSLTSSTLSGNSTLGTDAEGGGIYSFVGGVSVSDSIVSGNVAVNASGDEITGSQTLSGGNIVGDQLTRADGTTATVNAADIFNQIEEVIDANGTPTGVQAGVLADNGGPTETILILAGGSAQDTGLETPATTTDQRGEARPVGDNDLGAVELQVAPNSAPTITSVGATFVTETTDDSPIARSRVVSFEDVDLADDHTVTIAFNRVSDGVAPDLTDAELTALLTAGPVMQEQDSTTRTFDYTFLAPSTAFDYLAAGEKVTINYTLTIDDGNGGVLVRNPNVVVTGTNDAPTIDSVGATFVTETTDDSPIERSRVVSFEDVDLTDDHTVTIAFNRVSDGVAPDLTDAELTALLTAGPVTQTDGSTTRSFDYTFSAPSTAFDYLDAGETVTLNYTLTIDDGNGGVLVRTPNVVVTGTADDAPVVVADSHIEFDTTRLRLDAGGTPDLVQVALHEGDLNGVDDLEYSTNGTRKDAGDDVLGETLLASELYRRGGGGRFEDESLAQGDLRSGVVDIGGTRTVEGELLDPLLGDILAIDAFKIRQDADAVPDSFLFAGDDADGFDPDSAETVLKGGQGLRANSGGFGLEFGVDRNGAGKPDFAGDGGPTKEIARPEVLLFTLDKDLVGTGVSFGVDRATGGVADVALDFYEIDRDTGLYTRLDETVLVTEIDDGAPTGSNDALAALDFSFDAVAFSSADGDRFRLEQLEIATFADLG